MRKLLQCVRSPRAGVKLCENFLGALRSIEGPQDKAPSTAFSPELVEGSGRTAKCMICNT
jgi:hypothetical protein